jgi:hypothetical protein
MPDRASQNCVYCCGELGERHPKALGESASAAQDDLGVAVADERALPRLRELAERVTFPPDGAVAHHHEHLAACRDQIADPRVSPHDADLQYLLGGPVHGVDRARRRPLHVITPSRNSATAWPRSRAAGGVTAFPACLTLSRFDPTR